MHDNQSIGIDIESIEVLCNTDSRLGGGSSGFVGSDDHHERKCTGLGSPARVLEISPNLGVWH